MSLHFSHERLELRTRRSFTIARAASVPVRESLWVRVRADDGMEGWGEAATTTKYYGETAATAEAVFPLLVEAAAESAGPDRLELERAEVAMMDAVGGNSAARAGFSAALHDLAGKRLGLPTWKMLGLSPRAPASSFTISIDDIEVMRERVREAASYPILKIKVGTPQDESILQMIREEAPEKVLRVDANTGWTVSEAIRRFPMLEAFDVEFVEQPLHPDDIDGMRELRRRSRIPIAADESCRTSADIPRLAGAVDIINIKLAKCGGLREALRMVHVARAHRLQVMLGCMIESSLGIAAAVQVAPLADYLDLDGAALLADDPFAGPGIGPDGTVHFNDTPGLGVSRKDGDPSR